MKAPNEELIAELQQLANEIEISYRIESIEEAVKALQSQAERIAKLERESETHAKAYGLAIVERDNLRTELKTAQEGWRCECSTDDACRFARERDALRAELAAIAATEPVAWIDEYGNAFPLAARQYSIVGKGWKPLFTRPMPAQDVTELVEALEEYGRAGVGNSTDWRVQLSALRLAKARTIQIQRSEVMRKKILFILLFGVVGIPFVCIGFLINVIRISFEAGMINAEALMDDQFKDEAK